jgi:O-antigen ligase
MLVAASLAGLLLVQLMRIKPESLLLAWYLFQPVLERLPTLDIGEGIPHLSMDHLLFAALILAMMARVLQKQYRLAKPEFGDVLFLMFGIYWISRVSVSGEYLLGISALVYLYALPFVLHYLIRSLVTTRGALLALINSALFAGARLMLGAVYEIATGKVLYEAFIERSAIELAGTTVRTRSFLGAPWMQGAALSMLLPLSVYMFLAQSERSRKRGLYFVLALAFCVGLFWTWSRSAWVGALAALALQLLLLPGPSRFRTWQVVFLGLAVVMAMFLSMSTAVEYRFSRADTIENRLIMTRAQLQMWRQEPLFGVGTDVADDPIETRFFTQSSHNTYARLLAGIGLVGLTLFLLPQAWYVLRGWKQHARGRRDPAAANLPATATAMVVAYVANALGSEMLGSTCVNGLLWLAYALMLVPTATAVARNVDQDGEVTV